MIFAYRESIERRLAVRVRADSPLMAPEMTVDPEVLLIWKGSPVR
jgi:hypothetical protein